MTAWERAYPLLLLVGSLALSVVPLPATVKLFEPDWLAVLIVYFSFTRPAQFGLLTAFWFGLGLDVLTGALLGQNALGLITICYLSQRFHLRIRAFPVSQVIATGLVLLALYQFMLFWIDGVAGRDVLAINRVGAVLAGALILAVALALNSNEQHETRARIEA